MKHRSSAVYIIGIRWSTLCDYAVQTDRFIGELTSSEEGQVYWIPLEELKTKELATGMEYVLQILESEQVNECYMHLEADGYVGDLY